MKLSYKVKGVFCVIGVFFIHSTLGNGYTLGNISPYISSYLKLKTADTWVRTGHIAWIFTMSCFCLCFMALGGVVEKWLGARVTCLIGCVLMSLSTALTYFAVKANFVSFIILFGICSGFGVGLGFSVALVAAMKWFPRDPGVVSGIVSCAFGLGSFLFNIIQTKFINPLNISPRMINNSMDTEKYFVDERVLTNIPMCFIVLGVIYMVMQLIGVALMMDHGSHTSHDDIALDFHDDNEKEDVKIDTYNSVSKMNDEKKELITQNGKDPKDDWSVRDALLDPMCWLLMTTYFLNGFFIMIVAVHFKAFGQQFIDDDQYFSTLGAVGSICNSLGRLVWGRLYDIFKYRMIMSVLTIMMTVTMSTVFFCSLISNITLSKAIYFIWMCLLFIGQGGTMTLLPSAAADCYGKTNLAIIYGFIFLGATISTVIEAVISSFFFKFMQYKGQFILSSVATILCLIMTQFFRYPAAKNQQ